MRSKQRKISRGSVLLLTFFLLIILAMLGSAFLVLLPVEMRSAQKDRSAVQSSYGADAALQSAMNDLQDEVEDWDEIPLNVETHMANGWSYAVENVERVGNEEFRITTRGSLRGVVQRRAVALVDDGSGTEAVKNLSATVNGDAVGEWPATIPIKGDILWMGTWNVNNTGYDMNVAGNPPFKGTVYQTKQEGDGLMLEDYTASNPTAGQYPNLYTKGMAAIQPSPQLQEDDLLNSTASQQLLLKNVFNMSDGAAAQTAATSVASNVPAVVTGDGTTLTGGIFLNDKNGQESGGGAAAQAQREFTIRFTAPSPGIGVTTYTRGDGVVTTVTTIEAGTALPGGITGPSTSSSDRIHIGSTGGSGETHVNTLLNTELEEGHVVYVDGEVVSMQGTYRGNRTVGIRGDVAIDGELLKSDTARGAEPSAASKDALGIVGTIKAPNNSVGTNIKITTSSYPQPADNVYYMYCYLTGLDGNDVNSKLFKESSVPANTKVNLIGSLQFAPTTEGLMQHTTDFIAASFQQVTVDPLRPYGFPGMGRFVPRLRAYVDNIVAEQ